MTKVFWTMLVSFSLGWWECWLFLNHYGLWRFLLPAALGIMAALITHRALTRDALNGNVGQ